MSGWAKGRTPRPGLSSLGLALIGLFGLGAIGCDEDPGNPEENPELVALRNATAGFQDPAAAQAAGYSVLVTHPVTDAACLDSPGEGGMGRHFLRAGLVDDAVSVTTPEAVIYEPLPNGDLRLVAVEYLIPYEILGADEPPPTLLGQEFMHNPTFGVWMLHVWAWKDNPNGMFATWNPAVSCEFDAAVPD